MGDFPAKTSMRLTVRLLEPSHSLDWTFHLSDHEIDNVLRNSLVEKRNEVWI